MNPYDAPTTQANHPIKRYSPPQIVRLSIVGLALSLALGIAKVVYLSFQRGNIRVEQMGAIIGFCCGLSILTGIIYLILRGLYRGSKIAFWIAIAHAAFAVIAYKSSFDQFARFQTQWEKGLFLMQGILQLLSSAALLSHQSWLWFNKKDTQH